MKERKIVVLGRQLFEAIASEFPSYKLPEYWPYTQLLLTIESEKEYVEKAYLKLIPLMQEKDKKLLSEIGKFNKQNPEMPISVSQLDTNLDYNRIAAQMPKDRNTQKIIAEASELNEVYLRFSNSLFFLVAVNEVFAGDLCENSDPELYLADFSNGDYIARISKRNMKGLSKTSLHFLADFEKYYEKTIEALKNPVIKASYENAEELAGALSKLYEVVKDADIITHAQNLNEALNGRNAEKSSKIGI